MKLLALKEVRLSNLVLPGDFKNYFLDPSLAALTASIDAVGLLNEPIVEQSTMRPIAGLKRIAAHHKLTAATIMCKMVELEPGEDFATLRAASNAEFSAHVLPAEAERIYREQLAIAVQANPDRRLSGRGRTKTVESIAREATAKILGIKPSSIAANQARRRKKGTIPPPPALPSAPVETFGLGLEPDVATELAATVRIYSNATASLRAALTELGKLPVCPRVTTIYDALKANAHNLKIATPVSICLWCKRVPEVMTECARCAGRGYVGSEGPEAPAHLRDIDAPMVNYRGKAVPMADFFPEPQESALSELEDERDRFQRDVVRAMLGAPDPDPNNGADMDPADWMMDL